MIRPHRAARMAGRTRSVIAITEQDHGLELLRQSSGACPEIGVGGGPPVLLTSTPMAPSSASMRAYGRLHHGEVGEILLERHRPAAADEDRVASPRRPHRRCPPRPPRAPRAPAPGRWRAELAAGAVHQRHLVFETQIQVQLLSDAIVKARTIEKQKLSLFIALKDKKS